MRQNLSRTVQIFFSPETFVPFLIGSTFLAVLGNAITQVLFNLWGDSTQAAIAIAVGAVLIFAMSVALFAKGLEKIEPTTLPGTRQPKKYQGLVLLVSREKPCQVAITYHVPELQHCWLLCSVQTRSIAESLVSTFSSKHKIQFNIVVINDVYDPWEYYQEVRKIYRNLPNGLLKERVIADYTGMTAHGSVGIVLSSLAVKSPLQYTPAHPNDPRESLEPIEIILHSQQQTT